MLKYFLLCLYFVSKISADTPAHCLYEDIQGEWSFNMGEAGYNELVDCSSVKSVKTSYKVTLKYPDVAVDEFNNKGFWTLIYNQGFEVVIRGRKFFAFSRYFTENGKVISVCNETFPGWSHTVLGRDWACFYGSKTTAPLAKVQPVKSEKVVQKKLDKLIDENKFFKNDLSLIDKINSKKSLSWKAKKYEEFEKMTIKEMRLMSGGKSDGSSPAPAPVSPQVRKQSRELPEEFDWRNVNGESYVSPVRSQASCGSCYAFASLSMNEDRLRIATKNKVKVDFSRQDVVDCSEYSQGCEGGFNYLIGGKYAEDYGLVPEDCNTYVGSDRACSHEKRAKCKKYFFTDYVYVGGYYGACNEDLMKIALVNHGPIAVSFQVQSDFRYYTGGVYEYSGLQSQFNPFQEVSHAVVIVGYGVDKESGKKFWTVKNSWGSSWGEKGYFRIIRGTNNCAIESKAVESFPIF